MTFRISGVVLPQDEQVELFVHDGRVIDAGDLTARQRAEAELVHTGGWIIPGLVDAHCHIGLDAAGAVDEPTQERQALDERAAGALLVRDAGSAADTRWIDERQDLPKIIRAGRHLARSKRYIRNYGWEIEPDELVGYVEQEARRSDGWVKLVGDWIDRDAGDLTPCWPPEVLGPAIERAHQLGARVTAHVFGPDALADLVAAGIDCIEHGTGLTSRLADEMARRGTALVPTMLQVQNFPSFAAQGQSRFPAYATRIRDLYARRHDIFRQAVEAGVRLYAGTDAGGINAHGQVATEIRLLSEVGLRPVSALAAGSWAARAWLGAPDRLVAGVSADLVVYDVDPRFDLGVLTDPARIVLRGQLVG